MSQHSLEGLGSLPVWHVSLKPEDSNTINTREPVYFTPEAAAVAALELIARSSNAQLINTIYVSRYVGTIIKQEHADRVEKAILNGEGIPLGEAVNILGFALNGSQRVHEWTIEMIKALVASQEAHQDSPQVFE